MKRKSHGFSLPELLIVVAILGVLTTLGIQANRQLKEREEVNALAISLAGWLEQVRKSALLGAGCTVTINNTIGADGIVATATTTNPNTAINDSTTCLSNSPLDINSITNISPSTSFSITGQTIEFSPRGTVNLNGNPRIDVPVSLEPNGPERCIAINGLISHFTISKGGNCGSQEVF